MGYTIGDDVLDSRDIETRINEIKALGKDADADDKKELATYLELKGELDEDQWLYGIVFILQSDREDAMKQDFDEFGWIKDSMPGQLYSLINWSELADEYFGNSYDEIEIDGIAYYYK